MVVVVISRTTEWIHKISYKGRPPFPKSTKDDAGEVANLVNSPRDTWGVLLHDPMA